ncbi:MAG: hypothetical protein IKN04_14960 [Clostridia bacterium]|nr:hypothetical protein [Clostridia bacterium]
MKSSDMTFHLLGGTKILSAKELSETVYNTIHYYESREAQERKRANMTREEVAKEIANEYEEENQRIKKQLQFSVASLSSQNELDAYNAFVEKHAQCRCKRRIDEGKMPYVIQQCTGIGRCTTVYCQVCGASQDITDVSCW